MPEPETKRPYKMRQRARSQEETRRRIVEATMELHEELGPRATTISAIAERAGVQRLTVYRHFPDETAVFQACTSHWQSLNPPPDPARWAEIDSPAERFGAAVAAFYDYYSGTRRMWAASFRDVDDVPALQGPMRGAGAYRDRIADDLARAVDPEGSAWGIRATARHALHFLTWQDLEDQGLANAAKVALVTAWLEGALERAR